MKTLTQFLFTLLALACASVTLAATSPVGATPGSFAVSPSGAATYNIPIQVPPGVGGMQPNISLVYNSQAGNGIAGVGWNIGGLSAITRCGATIDRDGFKGGVNLDWSDKYCLDGQRLILVTPSGTYGYVNTEYRTEIESFNKVVASSTYTGNGPTSFTVTSKNGVTTEYGVGSGSQQFAQNNGTVLSWYVSKIKDVVGNSVQFFYTTDSATSGEHRIDHIDYTYNGTAFVGGTQRRVQFNYGARTDVETSYVSGGAVKNSQRLSGVQTSVGMSSVRSYNLGYDNSAATGRSRLANVQECSFDGACLLTTLNWQAGSAGDFTHWSNDSTSRGAVNDFEHYFVDVNGDGRADWIQVSRRDNYGCVGFATPDGNFVHWSYCTAVVGAVNNYSHYFADVNGDGRADWIQVSKTGDDGWVGLATGDGQFQFWTNYSNLRGSASNYAHYFADVNGDGRADWIQVSNSENKGWVGLATGDGNFQHWTNDSTLRGSASDYDHYFVDVNGDGRVDWIQVSRKADSACIGLATPDGNFQHWTYCTTAVGSANYFSHYFADVNGDGLADWIQVSKTGSDGWVGLATGDGHFQFWTNYSNARGATNYFAHYFADVNEDGRADWIQVSNTGNRGWVGLAAGDGNFKHWTNDSNSRGSASDYAHYFADVNGDGRADWIQVSKTITIGYVGLVNGDFPDLLANINTGLGAPTTLTYKPLTDTSVYTKEGGAVYPVKDVQDPLYVVSAVATSNGLGGFNTANYSYAGMKEHQTGRGNLGFHTMSVSVTVPDGALTTTSISTTTYRQDYPYIGAPLSSTATVKGVVVSESSNVWANARTAPDVPYVASGVVISREVNTGLEVTRTTTTNSAPDTYGNNTNTTVATSDGFTTVTANTFYKDLANWPQSVLVKSEITSTVPAAFSDTGLSYFQKRTSVFVYQMGPGTLNYQLKNHVVQPATNSADGLSYAPTYTLGADTLVTTTGYDLTYGYPNLVTVSGTGLVSRSTSTAINFATNTTTTTNALNQSESQTIDPKFSVPLSGTGPNGLVTTWSYDGFGRRVKEVRNDGTASTSSLNDCGTNPGCNVGTDPDTGATRYARYSSTAHTLNTSGTDMAPSVTVYYDILGREMRSETLGLNSTPIYKDTIYDTYGSVKKASRPYFSNATAYWTTPGYDVVGRVKSVTGPDGGVTNTTYNGFTTTVTAPSSNDGLTRKRTEVKNSQGQVVTVQDRLGSDDSYSTITYRYDAFGNLGKVTTTGKDTKTSTTTSSYDLRGRKISMKDPDMGTWVYTYNVLGELLTQKNANLQTTTMTYDKLGRMLTRVEAEGTSTWTYDTALHGIGKLASVKSSTTGTYSFERVYYYDAYGRPYGLDTTIGGVLYTMNTNYDQYTGRVSSMQFPSTVTGLGTFMFYNNYTNGYLTSVSSLANNGGTKFWTLPTNGIDAEGRVINETLGNSTTTLRKYDNLTGLLTDIDTTGPLGVVQNSNYSYYTGVPNLKTRDSLVTGANYTETFTYDELNRVLSANITGGASKAFSYDSLGNMLTKTGVGTYTYGTATVRPHAVTKVTGTINGVVAPAYAYDNNGNLTSGAGRTLTYTSFNLPKSVTLGTASQSYYYDPEHVRFAMTEGTANKTIYLNPRWDAGTHFEKETKGAIDEYKHFIYAGSRPVAMYVVKRDNTAQTNSTYTRYLHTDHLGSVDVITKEDGSVAERLGYDAWGKRRNAIGTDSTTQLTSNITHHGYTGHEMIDSVGLINMNGRWYDPMLGRMMQADPTVSMPENLQSYNRYSYVMNNPLSYTDPTGYRPFWSKRKIAAITRDILKDVANSKVYLGGKTYRVGGILAVGLLTNPIFGGTYAWSNRDGETVTKAYEVAAVIVASVWAGQEAYGAYVASTYGAAVAASLYVAESAAIGYTSSYAISRVYGASVGEANRAGLEGARAAAIIAALDVAAQTMRAYQINNSKLNPSGANSSGVSAGVRGDHFKLAGCRWPCTSSPLGDIQGGQGKLFGFEYPPGGVIDFVVENFSGTHDTFNSSIWYTEFGNGVKLTGVAGFFGEVANGVNVVLASPFAIASMLPPGAGGFLETIDQYRYGQ